MLLSKVLLDGIVDALDHHVLKARPLQQVGHRWGVAERIHSPTDTGLHTWTEGGVYSGVVLSAPPPERTPATQTQVSLQPLVSLHQLVQHGKVVGVGFIAHHPPARHHLQLPRLQQTDPRARRIKAFQQQNSRRRNWSRDENHALHSPFDQVSLLLIDVIPPLGEEANFCPDHLPPNNDICQPTGSPPTAKRRFSLPFVFTQLRHHIVQDVTCLVQVIVVKCLQPA